MKGMRDGVEYEIPATEANAIAAERAAHVEPVRFKVEKFVGTGANAVTVYENIHRDLSAGQITALEADGYTVTEL